VLDDKHKLNVRSLLN